MNKYWVVLKTALTRPWVWLMLAAAFLQIFPLVMFSRNIQSRDLKLCVPNFEVTDSEVSDLGALHKIAKQNQLSSVQGLNVRSLQADWMFSGISDLKDEPAFLNSRVRGRNGDGPILSHLPQLKSLVLQPPILLGSEGWRRIGQLHQLERLVLANVGSVDVAAQRTVSQDLPAALQQLRELRHLNLNNAGGNGDWAVPPLPKLEAVELSDNKQLESSLETMAAQSPNLHTLTLHTYQRYVFTDRMLVALSRMANLKHLYVVCLSKQADSTGEISRQVAELQGHLPRVAVHRGYYSMKRLFGSGILLVLAGFLPFVCWYQSGLTLAQPLAAVMPGHRRPHLFWPVSLSLAASLAYIVMTMMMGVSWPMAVALGCMSPSLVAMVLPGHDVTPQARQVSSWITTVDFLCMLGLPVLGFASPLFADAILIGDYPLLSVLAMFWFLFGMGWKIVRASRLHRILAESGMTGIPGLNLGMQQMFDQPFKPAPGWSMAGWQLKRMENAIDRRIAGMDRTNWVDMLRRASPSNPGMLIGIGMMVVFIVVFQSMPGMRNSHAPKVMPYSIGMMQAMMMILMMNTVMWLGRRSSIASDFLRPISRPEFWKALRLAIFHDLKWGVLFGLGWGLFSLYMANKGSLSMFTVTLTLTTAVGFLAFYHAWMTLIVICKRLWLLATLAVFMGVGVTSMTVGASVLSFGEQADPPLAILLAFIVLAAGGLMQWGVSRKLPDWELGA